LAPFLSLLQRRRLLATRKHTFRLLCLELPSPLLLGNLRLFSPLGKLRFLSTSHLLHGLLFLTLLSLCCSSQHSKSLLHAMRCRGAQPGFPQRRFQPIDFLVTLCG